MTVKFTMAAGAAAFFGLVACHDAQAGLYKEIRNWQVSCTNGLTCEMSYFGTNAQGFSHVGLRRAAAPEAGVEFLLPAGSDVNKDDGTGRYLVQIDGNEVVSIPVANTKVDDRMNVRVFGEKPFIDALLSTMSAGSRMEIFYKGAVGNSALQVPLDGVKGSLLYMDESQGRLGRADALVARGDKAPPKEAPARDLAQLSELPPVVRNDFTATNGGCSDLEEDSFGGFGAFEVSVDDTRLIVVPCGLGGAYNQPYAIYAGYDTILERVGFPDVRGRAPTVTSTAYNVDYDPKTKTLTSFFKGRGIGDCGVWYKWAVAGVSLVLAEKREKGDCDEKDMGGPQHFPVVWAAKP
ncbi:DUF1176 domain-containing protein [Rhizobium sp. KVB221]|uniref:DUF1176 domain-containing protein n=1 Tax=Rhizobium setariae TaxID=2801340 RepID=A0A937CPL3_9HYPH|nr:DUF1176 domain-containing protein [Rhizobium setariae]MBL0371947.1 DUF1176 domain-containing protein [Rhizobium setariae]